MTGNCCRVSRSAFWSSKTPLSIPQTLPSDVPKRALRSTEKTFLSYQVGIRGTLLLIDKVGTLVLDPVISPTPPSKSKIHPLPLLPPSPRTPSPLLPFIWAADGYLRVQGFGLHSVVLAMSQIMIALGSSQSHMSM